MPILVDKRDCRCRLFRRGGVVDPAAYSHAESLKYDAASVPNSRLQLKLHCSNLGFHMMLKKGWQEGKGLGANATGRTEPYLPVFQSGSYEESHQGLGWSRYQPKLAGEDAEYELRVQQSACTSVFSHTEQALHV